MKLDQRIKKSFMIKGIGLFLPLFLYVFIKGNIFIYNNMSDKHFNFYSQYSIMVTLVFLMSWFIYYLIFRKVSVDARIMVETDRLSNIILKDENLGAYDCYFLDEVQKSLLLIENAYQKRIEENDDILGKIENYNIEFSQLKKQVKKLEYQCESTKIKNSIIKNTIQDMYFLLNCEGTLIQANDAFIEKLGYRRHEIVGQTFLSFIENEEDYFLMMDQIMAQDKGKYYIKIKDINEEEIILKINYRKVISDHRIIAIQCVATINYEEVIYNLKLKDRYKRMAFLNRIKSSLIDCYDMKILVRNIVQQTLKFSNSIQCGIILYEENNDRQKLSKTLTVASQIRGKNRNQLIQHLIRWYVDSNVDDALYLLKPNDDLSEEIRTFYNNYHMTPYVLFGQLKVRNQSVGLMITVLDKAINKDEFEIFKIFTSQSASVIYKTMLYESLKEQYIKTIQAIINMIESKDKYTEGHSRRVAKISRLIGHQMNMNAEQLEKIQMAGVLHDAGKICIKQKIIKKEGKLSNEEYECIKKHSENAVQILKPIGTDQRILEGILYHHKRYDLKGYPENRVIKKLPLFAQIIGVADAFDAMTSERTYSDGMKLGDAIDELKTFSGTQFSPDVVNAMIEIYNDREDELHDIVYQERKIDE